VGRCHLAWKDDTTFVIGWADSVKVAMVKPRPPGDTKSYGGNAAPLIG
jgi:hypothetical protein